MVRTNRLLAFGLAFGVVLLAGVPGSPARADDKGKAAEPVNCVVASQVARKVAIDNKTVLVELKGKKYYRP